MKTMAIGLPFEVSVDQSKMYEFCSGPHGQGFVRFYIFSYMLICFCSDSGFLNRELD